MRMLSIAAVLFFALPSHAQDADIEALVVQARAQGAEARCTLRASRRVQRLAARHERAQSPAVRARLAAQLAAVADEREACIDAVAAEQAPRTRRGDAWDGALTLVP